MRNDLKDKKPEECNYSFFQNKECEFFPCHETNDPDNFNCLFCYCPLYALGSGCKGNFKYTEKGVKVCTECCIPHHRKNFSYITSRYEEIKELAAKNR